AVVVVQDVGPVVGHVDVGEAVVVVVRGDHAHPVRVVLEFRLARPVGQSPVAVVAEEAALRPGAARRRWRKRARLDDVEVHPAVVVVVEPRKTRPHRLRHVPLARGSLVVPELQARGLRHVGERHRAIGTLRGRARVISGKAGRREPRGGEGGGQAPLPGFAFRLSSCRRHAIARSSGLMTSARSRVATASARRPRRDSASAAPRRASGLSGWRSNSARAFAYRFAFNSAQPRLISAASALAAWRLAWSRSYAVWYSATSRRDSSVFPRRERTSASRYRARARSGASSTARRYCASAASRFPSAYSARPRSTRMPASSPEGSAARASSSRAAS